MRQRPSQTRKFAFRISLPKTAHDQLYEVWDRLGGDNSPHTRGSLSSTAAEIGVNVLANDRIMQLVQLSGHPISEIVGRLLDAIPIVEDQIHDEVSKRMTNAQNPIHQS